MLRATDKNKIWFRSTPNSLGNMPKPWIALSGDDDGIHYSLTPASEDLDNWEYTMEVREAAKKFLH